MAGGIPRQRTPASGRPAIAQRANDATIGAKKCGWRAAPPSAPSTTPRNPPVVAASGEFDAELTKELAVLGQELVRYGRLLANPSA